MHGFWLPISEIPDCPSIDGSIPAAATDTDGGLGNTIRVEYSTNGAVAAATAAVLVPAACKRNGRAVAAVPSVVLCGYALSGAVPRPGCCVRGAAGGPAAAGL